MPPEGRASGNRYQGERERNAYFLIRWYKYQSAVSGTYILVLSLIIIESDMDTCVTDIGRERERE